MPQKITDGICCARSTAKKPLSVVYLRRVVWLWGINLPGVVYLNMIEMDTSDTLLVQEGVPWPHQKEPCSREMIHLLERAEAFVSWFQPKDGGVDDQFPTIRVGTRYCKLSLRLQKALFRHVRLQRDFVNRERTPDGVVKLRIPTALFMDKKKTASRFMVRTPITSV